MYVHFLFFLLFRFGSWVGEGNNWCSPYKGWQLVYDNSPYKILANQGVDDEKRKLVLGNF